MGGRRLLDELVSVFSPPRNSILGHTSSTYRNGDNGGGYDTSKERKERKESKESKESNVSQMQESLQSAQVRSDHFKSEFSKCEELSGGWGLGNGWAVDTLDFAAFEQVCFQVPASNADVIVE